MAGQQGKATRRAAALGTLVANEALAGADPAAVGGVETNSARRPGKTRGFLASRRSALMVLISLIAAAMFVPGAQGAYTTLSLGTLGFGSSGTFVNDSGQVAGYNLVPTDFLYTARAFFWSPEMGMVDIGPGDPNMSSGAAGLSNSGEVVGAMQDGPGSNAVHGFSWTPGGGLVELATLGGSDSAAKGVNDVGQIVGYSDLPGGGRHAVMWTAADEIVDLGPFGFSDTEATAVNDAGQVVGTISNGPAWDDAGVFFWSPETGMIDIGSLGGYTYPRGLNDSGQVVGESVTTAGETHAFSWTGTGGLVDLGTLGGAESNALAVNESGQVVGTAWTAEGPGHPFLWSESTGMVDLGFWGQAVGMNDHGEVIGVEFGVPVTNFFSWTSDRGKISFEGGQAHAINNHGQVTGDIYDGTSQAALWNPISYVFHGFFAPVDNENVFNVVSAGRSVPVRFDLNGNQGLDIFAVGHPRSVTVGCSSGEDVLEEAVTAGESRLNYDATVNPPIGQYVYLWRTDRAWAGSCRQLQLRLNDGQLHTANFRFR